MPIRRDLFLVDDEESYQYSGEANFNLKHPSTNKEVLEKLAQSEDEYISKESQRRIHEL